MLRCRDLRLFLRALEAQLSLAVPLMQIAEVRRWSRPSKWRPISIMRGNLRSIGADRQLRIRSQIRCRLLGLHLLHIDGVGAKGRILRFKSGLDLIPGQARWTRCRRLRLLCRLNGLIRQTRYTGLSRLQRLGLRLGRRWQCGLRHGSPAQRHREDQERHQGSDADRDLADKQIIPHSLRGATVSTGRAVARLGE
jgi:hypothetical protein